MASDEQKRLEILLYSDDSTKRQAVIEGVGRRPARGMPLINWTEAATGPGVVEKFKTGSFDLLILDGETGKEGGMAVCRRFKMEHDDVPPVIILTARPQDRWLADWAEADAVVSLPVFPQEIQETVTRILN